MLTSDAGRKLIQTFEGCKLEAYLCPAGIPTIGFGHTGPEVKVGQRISQHYADVILEHDLRRFEAIVERMCPRSVDNSNHFSAMVSLCYNICEANFASSTLRKRYNSGAPVAASDGFLLFDKARVKGVLTVLPGLVARRKAERALYLSPLGVA